MPGKHTLFQPGEESTQAAAAVANSQEKVNEGSRGARERRRGLKRRERGPTSDSDAASNDSDAPEAVGTASARKNEQRRLQGIEAARKPRRSDDGGPKKTAPKSRRKKKGKQREEEAMDDQDGDEDTPALDNQPTAGPSSLQHRTFDDLQDEAATTPRLDPALFKQAEAAFEHAKRAVAASQGELHQGVETASRPRQRSRPKDAPFTARQVGDITVQQLQPSSNAAVDPSTALTSQRNQAYLKDRLFKRKKARLNPKVRTSTAKQSDKEPLLFDPLLDKPRQTQQAKPLSRSELEDRMRHRKSAEHTYSKVQSRIAGPSVAFGSVSSGTIKRKRGKRA